MKHVITTATVLVLAACHAIAAPTQIAESPSGAFLTTKDGMTLYVFDKDTSGVSNCTNECIANWPILAATAEDRAEGDYAVIDRADGKKQWTYKGMPLYTFFKDTATGDVKGDGVKGLWHIARP